TLNNTPTGTNDPAALTDATVLDDSFLWTRGYTTVWSGWENNLGPLNGLTATASLPVASNPNNTVITGPGYEYIVTGAATFALAYPPASTSQDNAVLTHRIHLDDSPVPVPSTGWTYVDTPDPANPGSTIPNGAIKLTTGNFVNNDIYEFSYTAK